MSFGVMHERLADALASSEASIYSNTSANVQIYQQGFVFPYEVTTMTTSKTKFGIATKDLIGEGIHPRLYYYGT